MMLLRQLPAGGVVLTPRRVGRRNRRRCGDAFVAVRVRASYEDEMEDEDDSKPADPNEWMKNTKWDTEQRAMEFLRARKKSGAEPRRYSRAGRDLDRIRTAISRGWILDEENGEYMKPESTIGAFEMSDEDNDANKAFRETSSGIWEPDFVNSKNWKDQWVMADEEWKVIQSEAKQTFEPRDALKIFETGGLRRVNPNIAGKMLRILGKKVKETRMDRFDRAGIRRDPRFAHLVGLTVAAARQNSEELGVASICDAIWALGVISGAAANAAEMEVLSNRASKLVIEMKPKDIANVAWALAICRHTNENLFSEINKYSESVGLKGFDAFKVSTLCWAAAHLQMESTGIVRGLSKWVAYAPGKSNGDVTRDTVNKLKFKQLCVLSWSLATVPDGVGLNSEVFKAIWKHICSYDGVEKFNRDESLSGKDLNQLHQVSIAVSASGNGSQQAFSANMKQECENAWTEQRRPPVISWFQRDVGAILSYMGEKYEEEAVVAGYRVDILLESIGVVLEVDGPSHFSRNSKGHALGQTMLKRNLLSASGYKVFPLAVTDWDLLSNAGDKADYLRSGLDALANGEEIPEVDASEDFIFAPERNEGKKNERGGGSPWNRRPTSPMGEGI